MVKNESKYILEIIYVYPHENSKIIHKNDGALKMNLLRIIGSRHEYTK